MAALTICAGLPQAPPQAPRSPLASASQAPTGAGAGTRPYCAIAQPKTSTTRPQTATAAAQPRLSRGAGPVKGRFRCRAAAPGGTGEVRGGSGCRTGAVDTIATSSLALRPRVLSMIRLPYTHLSPGQNYSTGICRYATLTPR